MKFLKLLIPVILISKLFVSYSMAFTCSSYLETNRNSLHKIWQEFVLTNPENNLSKNSRAEIENYFVDILVTNFITEYRPDLFDNRELVFDLISEDIRNLKNFLEFYRTMIYLRFEKSKEFLSPNNPLGLLAGKDFYKSEILEIDRLIDNLTERILNQLDKL